LRKHLRALSLCLLAVMAVSASGCWRRARWWRRHHAGHGPGPVVVTPPAPGPVVVTPPTPGPVVVTPPADVIVVETAPPPPRVEVRPPRPHPDHIWCDGHWVWRGGRHVWVSGVWNAPPRHGAAWVQPRWERGPRGWHLAPGHWR